MALHCTCAGAQDGLKHWSECMDPNGLTGEDCHIPNCDPRFPHNVIATDAQLSACGRLSSASVVKNHISHVAGDVELCRALSSAMAAALEGKYVGLGDEGDHTYFAFCAPGLEGVPKSQGLVSPEELRSACCGSLSPLIEFKCCPLGEEVERLREEEEGGWEGEVERWEKCAALAREHGAEGLTFMRPMEPRDILPPAVYPFFIVGRSAGGGVCGVCGFVVWT
jgi:hypothetical protein